MTIYSFFTNRDGANSSSYNYESTSRNENDLTLSSYGITISQDSIELDLVDHTSELITIYVDNPDKVFTLNWDAPSMVDVEEVSNGNGELSFKLTSKNSGEGFISFSLIDLNDETIVYDIEKVQIVVTGSTPENDGFSSIANTYVGTYSAGQGKTSLEFSILSCDMDGNIEAEFVFYARPDNPGVPSGKYKMQGTILQEYSDGSLDIDMHGIEWIEQPSAYMMLDFVARINAEKDRITSNDYEIDLYAFSEEASQPSEKNEVEIPESAVEYTSHYYLIYSDIVASWEEAKQYCEQLGGHLAVINDVDENAFLYSYMLNCGYESAYFGFIDENQDGNWKWVDGTTGNYTNWAGGEPSSLSEPYGMYYYKFTDGAWNDGRWGDDTTAFICEWESSTSEASNATSSSTISDFNSSLKEVYATSQLETQTYGDKTYVYSPQKVVDNDMSTCWSEGADDYGTGESITLSFDKVYEINEIRIWNGLCASEDLFNKNSRLREISIAFSDGQSIGFECSDGWNNSENVIMLPSTVETSSITITIVSVYEGEKYKDTCISEIRVS